jgi:hypothetical protein
MIDTYDSRVLVGAGQDKVKPSQHTDVRDNRLGKGRMVDICIKILRRKSEHDNKRTIPVRPELLCGFLMI